MLRFDIKENVEIKLELYRNRHEKIDEIPLDYIDNISYKFNDMDEISITIPQYVSNNGEKRFNKLYKKIKSRQIVIVTTKNKNGFIKQQKFTLADERINGKKSSGNKQFTAFSWEKTLERQRITVDALARQLTNKNDTVHIGEGVLDLICKKTGWKVGYVDQDARSKVSLAVQPYTANLFPSLTVNKVTNGLLIFDKNISITVPKDKPLYLTFHYTDAKVYDSSNNLLSTMNIENDLTTEPLYTSIKNIKAYHYSEAGNRYGIRYLITMTDNVQVERICIFTNCIDKKLTTGTINLAYDFGDVVEQSNIQYANFEAFDDSALKFLEDIQDVFECIFEYDTMSNTINAYAYKNLNKNSGYPLTLGENVIEINTTEDESIPTMLKIDSDKTSIVEHNPNGTEFIENYDYYIKNDLISDSLRKALAEFDRISKLLLEQWNVLKNNNALLQQKYTKSQSELQSTTLRIKGCIALLSSLFNADASRQLEVKLEIEQLEKRVTELMRIMNTYLDEIKNVESQISTINSKTQKTNMVNEKGTKIFNDDDLAELDDMKEVIQLTDSYYTTPYGLYGYAKKYLEDKANPKITFDVQCVDLVNLIQNPRGWNNILELGTLFPVEENEILSEKEIRLIELELIPIKGTDRVKSNSLKFSNKINENAKTKVGANIGKTTNKVTGMMTTYAQLWEESKLSNNFVNEMLTRGLDVASANIRGGVFRNQLDFSEAGMFIKSVVDGNTDNQIYIGGGMVAISTDGFKTCKTAIDANGVIAQTVIGKLILGEKLVIQDEGNTFYIGGSDNYAIDKEFGLSVYDDLASGRQRRIFLGLSKDNDGVRRAKLRLTSKSGQDVVISEEGIIQTSQFLCWDNLSPSYPMRIPYICDEGVMTNKKILMTLVFEKYRAFERGMSSGGTTATSSSGGGGTSSNGGGGTSGNGGYYTSTISSSYSEVAPYQVYTDEDTPSYAGSPHHVHLYFMQVLSHAHSMTISIPAHTHSISSHTHTISDHTHTLNTSHNHILEYAIHEQSSTCSNVKIYINDKLVRSGIYGDAQVDITAYIIKNSKNDIRIETDTNGRLTINCFTKAFVAY